MTMKLRHFLLLSMSILTLFASCFSCRLTPKPKRPLVSVYYHYGSQMLPWPSVSIRVNQDSTGITAIVFDRDSIRYGCYRIHDEALMQKLTDVIMQHKMYRYKRSYINPYVLDGDSWGFGATFHDSTSTLDTYEEDHFSSGGSNRWPKGDGLRELSRVLKEAMQSAELLYHCDEEGARLTEVEE